jgi:hypothetical protein
MRDRILTAMPRSGNRPAKSLTLHDDDEALRSHRAERRCAKIHGHHTLAEVPMTHHGTHHDAATLECIAACRDCAATCIETISHCLRMGGPHAAADHIALMSTCGEICATSANAMARGTPGHAAICAACADICCRCAESCEALGDDETMRACAQACRRCEQTCRAMAA